jgi:co-chaperonin GroES (HSP10)
MSESPRRVHLHVMPPLLKARLDFYKLKVPHFAPAFDRVYVMPLEEADQMDTTAGGIVLSDQTKQSLGAQRGLLVAAGAKALEELYSMGIGLGHRVYTMRFSRWVRSFQSPEDKKFYKTGIFTAGEVMGSEDLFEHLQNGDLWYELDTKTGDVEICDREEKRERRDPAPREYGV